MLSKINQDPYNEEKIRERCSVFKNKDDILNEIERVRKELHITIGQSDFEEFDEDMIKLSQYLDILLVEYVRHTGRDQDE